MPLIVAVSSLSLILCIKQLCLHPKLVLHHPLNILTVLVYSIIQGFPCFLITPDTFSFSIERCSKPPFFFLECTYLNILKFSKSFKVTQQICPLQALSSLITEFNIKKEEFTFLCRTFMKHNHSCSSTQLNSTEVHMDEGLELWQVWLCTHCLQHSKRSISPACKPS